MAGETRLFEDLSRMASGAFSALKGVGDELEARIREQFERMIARMDLVTREEFDAVQEMAATARAEQEALAVRVAALEAALQASGASESRAKPSGTAAPRPDTPPSGAEEK